MDIANRNNLEDYILEGCKILHLATEMPDEDHLVLEGEGTADFFKFREFQAIVDENIAKYNI